MVDVWARLEPHLTSVQKPARYIGCELGAEVPPPGPERVGWLLVYPDTYEIGLPNQGLQILYEILNERPDALAERAYAPWTDLEEVLRTEGIPLFSVDTHRSADEFDVIAFNLSAELVYTNVLNCIDLAGVPVRSADRTSDHPLIGAGGHATYNPEPLADFLDFVVLGDGEEVVSEINAAIGIWRSAGGAQRIDVLRALAGIDGVYVPALYEPRYLSDGRLEVTTPIDPAAPAVIEKRTIADLAEWPYPKQQLVPLTEVVHDRLNVEVFRGCTRGCRFCQAGMITSPVRERPADQVASMVQQGIRRTGYDEVALTSLSTADFSGIEDVVAKAMDDSVGCGNVSVSLPSLRVDAFTVGVAAQIQKARRTGLTFAPEAGTWRMRQVINKLITEEDLYAAVDSAFSQGWRRVKLYFLTGLPTETDEDTLGIIELARRCIELAKANGHNGSVTVSVGGFVPKAFTPFQWFGMNTEVELRRKINLLRDAARHAKGVQIKWHDPRASLIEGLVSRGDRRLGAVIEHVWRAGGTFQEWSEHFRLDLWEQAMDAAGLDMDWYCHRHRTEDETLPWDHLSAGLHKDFLWQDWRDALEELGLEDCRWTPCYDCGACTGYGIEHVVASAVPPAGGSQGTGQDLLRGGEVPVTLLARKPVGVGRVRQRVRFGKVGKVRFLSHRDVARVWERALRRSGVRVAYSEGFSPRPRLSFGLALSTGYESLGEYLDIDLAEDIDPDELPAIVTPSLPLGMEAQAAITIPPRTDSLQQAVTSSSWRLELADVDEPRALALAAQRVLELDDLPIVVERKGAETTLDARPAILRLATEGSVLEAELATQPRSLRPAELLRALDPTLNVARALRTHQWTSVDGARCEPIPVGDLGARGATSTPHAEARAS